MDLMYRTGQNIQRQERVCADAGAEEVLLEVYTDVEAVAEVEAVACIQLSSFTQSIC
jgi:hypothetical protein